ncbi:hypothetical protein [Phenylobacterium koreense]|uniref:Uncharacterized protein n=1 Tax=Phenylobacterium koreense TaxID=266125 RepID=A0ABV2EGL0_9CAUL
MALFKQALAHDVPIVDGFGRPTPEFQRFVAALVGASGGSSPIPPDTYVRTGLMPGWGSPTGTVSRATFATYAAPTASATYNQAQIQAALTHLQVLSQHVAAQIADLKTLKAFTS